MSEEYGNDYITIADEEGNEFELEVIDSLEYNGTTYLALLSTEEEEANTDEDDGLIILKVIYDDGEEIFATPDSDEELTLVYDMFMERLFEDHIIGGDADEDDEDEEKEEE